MLVPLLLAASLLTQTQAAFFPQSPSAQAPDKSASARSVLHFSVPAPRRAGSNRRMAPLTATLRLDSEAEEAREEEDLTAAINGERTARGLEPLVLDPLLNEAARAHSREMCALNYFDHNSPTADEQTPMTRYLTQLADTGASCPAQVMVGENIFYANETNGLYNISFANQSLMASPDHRRNILEPRFTRVGVGLYRDPQGRFWVTEMFLAES